MTAAPTTFRPRTLVAYYSRTGNTRHVAEVIAAELGAELEPIVDRAERRGRLGFLRAAREGKARTFAAEIATLAARHALTPKA